MEALAGLGERSFKAPDLRSEPGYARAIHPLTTFRPARARPRPKVRNHSRPEFHFESYFLFKSYFESHSTLV